MNPSEAGSSECSCMNHKHVMLQGGVREGGQTAWKNTHNKVQNSTEEGQAHMSEILFEFQLLFQNSDFKLFLQTELSHNSEKKVTT